MPQAVVHPTWRNATYTSRAQRKLLSHQRNRQTGRRNGTAFSATSHSVSITTCRAFWNSATTTSWGLRRYLSCYVPWFTDSKFFTRWQFLILVEYSTLYFNFQKNNLILSNWKPKWRVKLNQFRFRKKQASASAQAAFVQVKSDRIYRRIHRPSKSRDQGA